MSTNFQEVEVERLGYSIREFASGVGCSERHILNRIEKGEIPCVKLGERKIIPVGWVRKNFGTQSDKEQEAA